MQNLFCTLGNFLLGNFTCRAISQLTLTFSQQGLDCLGKALRSARQIHARVTPATPVVRRIALSWPPTFRAKPRQRQSIQLAALVVKLVSDAFWFDCDARAGYYGRLGDNASEPQDPGSQ